MLIENIPSPFAAEAKACVKALKMAHGQGLREIVVEGDARAVIEEDVLHFGQKKIL